MLTNAGYNTGIFGKISNDQGDPSGVNPPHDVLLRLVNQRAVSYIDSPMDYNTYDALPYFR